MIIQFDIPNDKAVKIVALYAEDNDTELTDEQYTKKQFKNIILSDIHARARNKAAEAAEDLTF